MSFVLIHVGWYDFHVDPGTGSCIHFWIAGTFLAWPTQTCPLASSRVRRLSHASRLTTLRLWRKTGDWLQPWWGWPSRSKPAGQAQSLIPTWPHRRRNPKWSMRLRRRDGERWKALSRPWSQGAALTGRGIANWRCLCWMRKSRLGFLVLDWTT